MTRLALRRSTLLAAAFSLAACETPRGGGATQQVPQLGDLGERTLAVTGPVQPDGQKDLTPPSHAEILKELKQAYRPPSGARTLAFPNMCRVHVLGGDRVKVSEYKEYRGFKGTPYKTVQLNAGSRELVITDIDAAASGLRFNGESIEGRQFLVDERLSVQLVSTEAPSPILDLLENSGFEVPPER